ncbi:type II toxin-antitoxin system VapC family toxin [Rhizobium sp. 9140]|uniref:type II toxin-antitoxin system VapC family toxin n=1 Tax=Rhizobium sp. 9140 TaxID=1761900 RepID=UPI00079A71B1|nr:PIN domain-containing protein [Rhizobium sp. 9140]CZT33756.1 Predicted nucleic acid-binding protein, contains PIN domain [Rhizobium sp. 9140]
MADSDGPIYLDTNVFIFASEETSEQSDLLNRLFSLSFGRPVPAFATSELTIAELLVHPFKRQDAHLIEHYQQIVRSSQWLMVVPVDREILEQSARLRAEGRKLKLPDAIHVATAHAAKARRILTADEGIRFQGDGVDAATSPGTDEADRLLRPDIPTLTTLLESLSP